MLLYISLLCDCSSGLQTGEQHSLAKLHNMIAADLKMQNLTDEKKQEYLNALSSTRDTQKHGVHANNAAAARDVFKTVESIQDQVSIPSILCDFRVLTSIPSVYSWTICVIAQVPMGCSSSFTGILTIQYKVVCMAWITLTISGRKFYTIHWLTSVAYMNSGLVSSRKVSYKFTITLETSQLLTA